MKVTAASLGIFLLLSSVSTLLTRIYLLDAVDRKEIIAVLCVFAAAQQFLNA